MKPFVRRIGYRYPGPMKPLVLGSAASFSKVPDCIKAGFDEHRGHLSIRLAKQAWDPYSMRVWPAVQKLPAPAAALPLRKTQAHSDQTGLLQTERIAANWMRPRLQANPSRSQPPKAGRRKSG